MATDYHQQAGDVNFKIQTCNQFFEELDAAPLKLMKMIRCEIQIDD